MGNGAVPLLAESNGRSATRSRCGRPRPALRSAPGRPHLPRGDRRAAARQRPGHLLRPPGTGKTFVAKALAQAVSIDASGWGIVQFHPSASYEDFFEGFRPDLDAENEL